MKTYKARGVVLHTVKYGESSSIVYLLTDVLGRQSYMVQGVRGGRSRSNKTALFQPMFRVEFEGVETRGAQLHRMKDLVVREPYASIPFDIRKSTISLFMAEVLYRLVRESEPNSPLFDFVSAAAAALDRLDEGVPNFHLWFLVRLSSYLGFYPGNEYLPGHCFDVREGLFVANAPQHGMILSRANAMLLSRLMGCEVEKLPSIAMSRAQRFDFLSGLLTYFGHHFDSIHNIRSIQIFKELF